MFASPIRPRTMTKEWQEASEEYLKVRRVMLPWMPALACDMHTYTKQAQGSEPITGYKGMLVQSKSEKDLPASQKLNDE